MKKRFGGVNSGGEALVKSLRRKYLKNIIFITVLSLAVSALSLAFAYLTKYIVNYATSDNGRLTLIFTSATLACLLGRILIKYAYSYFSEKLNAKISLELRREAFSAVMKSELFSTERIHSGEIMNRLTSDANEISADTTAIAPVLAGLVLQLGGTLALLFGIDVNFALIFLAGTVLTAATVGLYRVKIKSLRKRTLELDGESRSFIQDNLNAVLTVKAYNAEDKVCEKEQKISRELENARLKRAKLSSFMSALYSFIGNAGLMIAIVWFGAGLLGGTADYGSVTAVILLLLNVQQPVNAISGVISAFYTRSVSAERIAELLSRKNSDCESTAEKHVADRFERAEIIDLSFSFPEKTVLRDFSLTFKHGEKLALTGASGRGKTTLFKLLLGVLQPQCGDIKFLVDGQTYRPREVQNLFAFVPQGNYLITGTVKENLCFFAKNQPATERIEQALKTACAEFVFDLKGGINYPLKERGEGLSEGQIQRLAVARALLADREVLLFDEATSALDEQTEKRLMKNLCSLEDKTCIFITHRKTALEQFDEVYEIEEAGGVVKKVISR